MLLCDGCDHAFHMQCLRPAVRAVPPGDWFCPACEAQLQQQELSREDAVRWV